MKIRLLAFITALSMTFSLFSASSFAESEDVMSELPVATEEPVQNTVLPSETPALIPESTEVPVQETEEPFETPVPSEIPEEPVPSEEPLPVEQPEESPAPSPEPSPEPEEEEAEEEKEEEPQLFPGMPEGFSLSEEQLARKQALSEPGGVLSQLQNAGEGQEYETGTLFFSYENEEFAIMTAEAYGAELLCCEYGIALICLPDGISVLQAVEAAADMTNTLPAVEPNFIIEQWPDCGLPMLFMAASPYGISNEPLTKKEWSDWQESADPDLDQSSGRYQYYHEMIDTYTAWGVTRGSSGVKVAILDGGVFTEHEDLNCSSIPYSSRASYSASSHATNVAGIIGATYGNYAGGAGIAPGVTLESYDVFAGSLGGTEALLCIAINAAVSNGADIINLSLGSYRYSDTEQKCINDAVSAGVLIVAAAGNDGQNIKCYPAACKNVVSVAAVGRDGTRANFSNGGDWVTLSAPGVSMYSAYSGTGVYGELSGTSQAAPVVSGAAALYMSAMGDGNGDVNGDGVRNAKDVTQTVEALKGSCTRSSGFSSGMGAGVVNAAKLLGKASLKLNFRLSKDGYEVTSGNGCIVVRSDDRTAKLYIDPSTLDGETETPLTENTAYYIAYTVDSASPTVSDALSYAATFDEETGEHGILLAPLGSGKHTVKAVIQNGEGNVSKIFSCTFTLRINETVSEDEQSGEEVPGNLYVTGPELIGIGKSGQLRATLTGITGKAATPESRPSPIPVR